MLLIASNSATSKCDNFPVILERQFSLYTLTPNKFQRAINCAFNVIILLQAGVKNSADK